MDESGGLEGLVGRFMSQLLRRQLPQLSVNQRQQLLGGVRIALVDCGQVWRDLTHAGLG